MFLSLRRKDLSRARCLRPAGLQRNGLQVFATVFTLNVEYRGIVKDPVQRTQQSIILVEIAAPLRKELVAGEHNVEAAFFVVSSVNQVKEQPGILLASLSGGSELVPQLRHLNEIGLNSPFAALVAKSLSQMSLACFGRANECQILVGIDGGQRRKCL